MLLNTVSTNGRVEPIVNYQFYSPIATTVKAVYAQEGDQSRPASYSSRSTTWLLGRRWPAPRVP